MLVIQPLLHSTEKSVIKLADVLLLADFHWLAEVVGQRFENLCRIRVLLVALRHLPEEHLQIAHQFPRRLEPVQYLLLFGVDRRAVLRVPGLIRCLTTAISSLRLLARRRRQSLSIIHKLQDFLHESWQIVVNLKQRIKVASITDILQAARRTVIALPLLWIERLVRARANIVLLLLYRLNQHAIQVVVLIGHACDVLIHVHALLHGLGHLLVLAAGKTRSDIECLTRTYPM